MISVDAKDSTVYFVAPESFLGDRRFSYSRFLNFTLRIDSEFGYPSERDIVIEGANDKIISAPITVGRQTIPNNLATQYSVRLHELSGWTPSLSAVEFNLLLKDVRKIKIRGTYSQKGLGFLEKVSLDSATTSISDTSDPEVSLSPRERERESSKYSFEYTCSTVLLRFPQPAPWVEMCACQEGYQGQFCEQCKSGYRRDPQNRHIGPFAECVTCNCNNHSDSCDSETGTKLPKLDY